MDAEDTFAAVRAETATELERLGSDKLLVALTGADLTPDAVRRVAATRERGAATALSGWSESVEGPIADAFERAATAAGARADRIGAEPSADDAVVEHLETVDGTAVRVGAGLVAVPLIADRLYLQAVSFFVNEADEDSAATFRELRSGAGDFGPARDALAALDEDGQVAAREAAVEAIGVAYEAYATTLEGMGLDPKPVC